MLRSLIFVGILIPTVSLSLPASAQEARTTSGQKRALALEDYYRVRSVGSPDLSPDGRWVTYTVSTRVEEDNSTLTEAWIVATEGGAAPSRVEHAGQSIADASWGDDSRLRYTFEEAIWIRDPARPSDPPVRDASPSVDGISSPDGRWLARTQEIPAPERPALTMTEFERRHEERFQGDAFDWYPFRQDGERFPVPDRREQPPREVFIEPVDGSAPARQLTTLGLQAGSLLWTPAGDALLFTANEGILDELSYGATDMFQVSVEGQLTRLTDDGYNYSGLSYSPDGRWLAYELSMSTDMIIELALDHGGAQDIYVRPAAGGEPINLTEDWDLDPGTAEWSPDGRHLYFNAEIGGASHLFRVAVPNGPVEQVTTGERRLDGIDFDRDFERMAYTVGEFDRMEDVYVADIDGRNERRLTDIHAEFTAEVELATHPSERVLWNSYDGTRVEGFLLYPHGYDPARGPYPLIVMNHGGPHSASGYGFSFKNKLFAAHGYFVFLPNFRSSTGYGDDFKWGTWGGWGNNDGEDVLSGVDHLIARYPIDRDRVGTTGHSYGGIITNWLITRYPDRFRAAVPGAGESNWTSNFALSDISRTKETEFFGRPWEERAREIMIAQSPYFNCGGVQAATLFVHGEVDYRVPLEGAIQLYTCLKKQRVPTKMIIYEGQPHGISGHWNNVHRMMNELRWWETYLKPVTPVIQQ
jgi:dipeptidyl aminopeptidase/acylaminoacyl peptidase